MANISDVIEKFIIDAMQEGQSIQISRNELANYFSCAPSQINYVLSTRFTNERGYSIFSQRGGGGYIKLTKLSLDNHDLCMSILNLLNKPIDFGTAKKIINNLLDNDFLNQEESQTIYYAVTSKALSCPFDFENQLRSQILRSVIIGKLQNKLEGGE